MRRFIHDTLTVFFAVALLLVVAVTFAASVAYGRPLAPTVASTCYGVPAKVTLTPTGRVRAGQVDVRCAGSWSVDQGVQYAREDARKWSYGGRRVVTGRGATVIPAWLRDYHECGYWRQRIVLRGESFYSPVTEFCS